MKKLLPLLLLLLSCSDTPQSLICSAQVVGTIHDTRHAWIPSYPENDMSYDEKERSFKRTFDLSTTGGKNSDGTYVMRFFTNNDIASVYKLRKGKLVTENTNEAGNIVFLVEQDGLYTLSFDPWNKTYAISPDVKYIEKITSMQLNGFVYDEQGETEKTTEKRTFPSEKWDETRKDHEMEENADGSWSKTIYLRKDGGMHPNGIYQCLFSANHISDWGFAALNNEPGKLCGGSGYNSKQGRVIDSPIVFKVSQDGNYTLTMHPDKYWYTITPDVTHLNSLDSIQINGTFEDKSWFVKDKSHAMEKGANGIWSKVITLDKDETYCFDFSINENWDLDGITCANVWGKTWHSLPNTRNIIFRSFREGKYTITLDTLNNRFDITPPVLPILEIYSLQLIGNFPEQEMETSDGITYTVKMNLEAGETYTYRYAANGLDGCFSFVDYPYDGYRRLTPHGAPAPLTFTPSEDGIYTFTANIKTGKYEVTHD